MNTFTILAADERGVPTRAECVDCGYQWRRRDDDPQANTLPTWGRMHRCPASRGCDPMGESPNPWRAAGHGYEGWATLRIYDADLEMQGLVRWVSGSGWEAECTGCDGVVQEHFHSASGAVHALETHVEACHGGDNPGVRA